MHNYLYSNYFNNSLAQILFFLQRCICGPGPVKDAPKIKEVEGTVRVKREVKEEEPLKEKDQVPKGPQVAVVAPSTTKVMTELVKLI